MPHSNSHASYESEFVNLDEALASSRGIRVPFRSVKAAKHYQSRLHYARFLDRKRSTTGVEPDHPTYNTSIYDPIVCRVVAIGDKVYVYIERSRTVAAFEAIPEDEKEPPCTTSLPKSVSDSGTPPSTPSSEFVLPPTPRTLRR